MKKYRNKYRIDTTRAQWWNYGWNGAYFITICTKNRIHFFGEIVDGKMNLSPLGVIADILWHEIPHHAPFVELGDFVVMPDHIHGILILDKPAVATAAEPLHATALSPTKNEKMAIISPKADSIPTIIRSYKSAVTKHANRLGFDNGWQSRYHDHIIRNDAEYQRISDYIVRNPEQWGKDKFKKT